MMMDGAFTPGLKSLQLWACGRVCIHIQLEQQLTGLKRKETCLSLNDKFSVWAGEHLEDTGLDLKFMKLEMSA